MEVKPVIIRIAEESLKTPMVHSVLLPLADHIYYSLQRYKKGINVPLLVDEEIKRFYKDEYEVGRKGVEIINKQYSVNLNQEEASAIAFHIVNGTEGSGMSNTTKILDGVKKITEIISNDMKIQFDENALDYSRLIIHLRFLLKKIVVSKENTGASDNSLMYQNLLNDDAQMNKCLNDVSKYCVIAFNYDLTENDKLYLLIHILKNK